jgi:hypothetical protein
MPAKIRVLAGGHFASVEKRKYDMKAKNRVGIFDLDVCTDPITGTTANIYIAKISTLSRGGSKLTTIGWEAASFAELKALVDFLKNDLDVIVEKSKQHFEA